MQRDDGTLKSLIRRTYMHTVYANLDSYIFKNNDFFFNAERVYAIKELCFTFLFYKCLLL